MNEQTDSQLLRSYIESCSEAAFAELARRHVDFVYSAALRMVRDPHLAEDVTQGVFMALAKNAAQLTDRPVLSGWLHRTAQNIAAQTVRTIERRRAREQKAAAMNELLSTGSDASWDNIAPHLDAALGELSEPDRDAILLRYFEKKSAREIAQRLGVSDEAAQRRVSRAVERLREFFAKRGVTVGASGLAVAIAAHAVQAAPVGLVLTISAAAALTGTTLATTATVTATKAIAMTALQKTIVTATIAVLAGVGIYEARRTSQLREQVRTLQQQQDASDEQMSHVRREHDEAAKRFARLSTKPAPHLPAPPVQASATPLPAESIGMKLLRGGDTPRLTAEQAARYLDENRHSAASLLAAYRTSGDGTLLQQAMEKFPNDPQVAYEALFQKDVTPEERRRWLETLKKTAPENALANYLSASDYFKAGNTDQAVQELIAASGKQGFQDFTVDRWCGRGSLSRRRLLGVRHKDGRHMGDDASATQGIEATGFERG